MKLTPTDVIAGYAAIVATAALGWEVSKEIRSRRLKIEVEVTSEFFSVDDKPSWWARIEVRNHSDRPIRVESVGFDFQADLVKAVMIKDQEPGMTVPGVIAAHDSGFARFPKDKLDRYGVDTTQPLAGWARLSTGERFEAELVKLWKKPSGDAGQM
jgi:hypothetical protein